MSILQPLLRGTFGSPLLVEETCASTQDLLRGTELPEGAVAVCDHQSAGRGRSGRAWEDTPGRALLCSILLRPPADAPPLPQLSLVCGVAAAEAVELATELAAQVKWPNDVMLDRRKVGGVLLEAGEGEVVCGIGVNVNQTRDDLPPGTRVAAGSLRTVTGAEHDRASLLADLLELLERRYQAWLAGGLDAIYDALGARNFLFGRRVRVDGVPGTAEQIERDGRLAVRLDDGRHLQLESGEIEVER